MMLNVMTVPYIEHTETLRTNYTEMVLKMIPVNGFTVILAILFCIVLWRLFAKAGMAPWRSVIPVVNFYSLFGLCWDGYMLWVQFFLLVFAARYHYMMVTPGLEGLFENGSAVLFAAFSLLAFLVHASLSRHLARSFGKKPLYALGLTFLPFFFLPYLAFDDSEYRGNLSHKESWRDKYK